MTRFRQSEPPLQADATRARIRATSARWLLLICLIALVVPVVAAQQSDDFAERLSAAAIERTRHEIRYDGSYVRISYPGGDVPANTGVCTDVVIRAYRALGIDLQKEVHEDMRTAFEEYPQLWGLVRPDSNIDHRRVPNLARFFQRNGERLTITDDPGDYRTGEIVTWDLGGNVPHIGIVVDRRSADGRRPLVVHNIGAGPKLEDVLLSWEITGHYMYGE